MAATRAVGEAAGTPEASPSSSALDAVIRWYGEAARTLPWRSDPDPWGVLVSEVMLQQTPVIRVLPVYEGWIARWPRPHDLAADSPGEAIRMWGRLGYPRRALRLHAAATLCRDRFDGTIPTDVADLRSLPGVGEYTAAAVAAFAFGPRHAVLDTNVRRVHARWLDGVERPASSSVSARERQRALELLPVDPVNASHASIAVMELGALVCTTRSPACDRCPLSDSCAWRASGHPEWDGPRQRAQSYSGTDRQCRGRLLTLLRASDRPITKDVLDAAWPDAEQRERALGSLVTDGLVVHEPPRAYRLPS